MQQRCVHAAVLPAAKRVAACSAVEVLHVGKSKGVRRHLPGSNGFSNRVLYVRFKTRWVPFFNRPLEHMARARVDFADVAVATLQVANFTIR